MPKALGLMNPTKASKSTGGFKEGLVRIDSNSYKVHAGKPGEGEAPIPATKWSWKVTRLDEGREPLTDEHDQVITEELLFSFGGKCLPFIHPGQCESLDDEEVQDLGTSAGSADNPGAEGNTVYLVANDWAPNEKSGIMTLTKSMAALQVPAIYLDRCWAPDWVGCIFDMRSQPGEKGKDGNTFNYKVVHKVVVGPGGAKPKAVKNGSKPNDAEEYLAPILHGLSEELDAQTLTRKAFLNRVRGALDTAKTDSKLLVPVLSLCKDDKWLEAHGETFDYFLDPVAQTITFGKLPVA